MDPLGRMDPQGRDGSLQAGWVHVAKLSPSKDGCLWSGWVPQQGWVLLGCEGTPAGVTALATLLGSVGDEMGLEWGPSASRGCCAGKYWGLCLRELLGIGGAVLVVTGICARGPGLGASRVWDPAGDIRGCAGSCERGLCRGVGLDSSGVCAGLLWGCAGAGARWEPQQGRLVPGGDSGVAWGQEPFGRGTAPLSAACSGASVLAPILPRLGSPSLQPAPPGPRSQPRHGAAAWCWAPSRCTAPPAVRGPAGQTLPSGTRFASALAVHHGAASPSPCPQLCRHNPVGGE